MWTDLIYLWQGCKGEIVRSGILQAIHRRLSERPILESQEVGSQNTTFRRRLKRFPMSICRTIRRRSPVRLAGRNVKNSPWECGRGRQGKETPPAAAATELFSTCLSDQMAERDRECRRERGGNQGAAPTAEKPTGVTGFHLRRLPRLDLLRAKGQRRGKTRT